MALVGDERREAHKPTTCEECGGKGFVDYALTGPTGQQVLQQAPCPKCDADGKRFARYADRILRSYIGKDGRSK